MKTREESRHEERLPLSNNPNRKKHYEAPQFTILSRDQAKALLVATAIAGDRDAERLLVLISEVVSKADKN
jgi:hypothetical protein